MEALNFGVSRTAHTHGVVLAKAQFHWYLNTNLWLLQDCFDCKSWALTARCPSVMETVAQMSRFKGSGPGAGGVLKWNLPPWGPGDFVWEHVCTAAACKDRPASGPYINHHMSCSLNKMEHLLCFLWTQLQQISLGSSSSLAVLIGSSVSGFHIPYFSIQQVCKNMGKNACPAWSFFICTDRMSLWSRNATHVAYVLVCPVRTLR